ncbi:glutamate racemase [Numidum massiliense]|uniref:glutamate racemase n=1 Tax=Numidum massiliense TaxID=1522315 RepID=UPI0006D53393|nr:glutamate racemase [Numidum massiliense]
MTTKKETIGILDSGVGGLTVAREVMRQLPRERIVYFGDTVNCPYGPRSADEVRQFTFDIVRFLQTFSLKALVIACNTATAVALEEAKRWLTVPVFGVIHPGARAAIKATNSGRIGVIGTEGTIKSGAYARALTQINADLHVVSHACPTLVPLVESGQAEAPETLPYVEAALKPLKGIALDTLILGCTHYPLLHKHISHVMGNGVQLISSAEEVARELSAVLHHQELLAPPLSAHNGEHQFFTSGAPQLFRKIAKKALGLDISVQSVQLKQAQ